MDQPMTREHALQIVSALQVVAETDGVEAALRIIDLWIDSLAEDGGEIDVELKEAAYAFIRTFEK